MSERAPLTRTLLVPDRYDFAGTVGQLGLGRYDPTARFVAGTFWWATRTPAGPAALALRRAGGELRATGYGPGADWVVQRADAVAGLRDDVSGFGELAAAHPVVARVWRTHQGIRLPASGRIFPRLLRAICEQRVTTVEARQAHAAVVRHFPEPAPGPVSGLLLPPDPVKLADAPYWVFHPLGLERRRAETLRRGAAAVGQLERCADPATATSRLTAIAGIGPWTIAEVVRTCFGDPDAVSVGDYHLPNTVAWALAGEPRGDDTRMLALLAPFPGHRGRVCGLLAAAGISAPRYGPRMPVSASYRRC